MRFILITFIFVSSIAFLLKAQNIRVVNMIPNALSNETNQDSEPHLAVNSNNPDTIVASAFTANPTGATATAPVFISVNGGSSWVLNNIVPSLSGMTADITVGLSRNNILYSGILTGGYTASDKPQLQILRKHNYVGTGTMNNLVTSQNDDQPYTETATPLGGSRVNYDHVYVGFNSNYSIAPSQSAAINQSLNSASAAPPANFNTIILEKRTTVGQDGPPIRSAIHPNGTVYSIFDRFRYYTSYGGGAFLIDTFDVVVVRDNDWGQGASPYADLTDPSDGLAGRIIASNLKVPFNTVGAMGQARVGDRLSIAVDPRNSQTVYIAFTDRPSGITGNTITIHIRRSTNGGTNWSSDLLTINSAIIPQLAVNIKGDIGFLYQQLTGTAPNQQWVTHFRQSTNGGTNWSNIVLSQTPSNSPARTFSPYLGDYAGLKTVGKDFYGVFSANNTPDSANFPSGVTYQRNSNFTTHKLRNLANTADVSISIDPFFFEIQQIDNDQDFYVRDWTDNATTNDIGLEPSTNPVFYATSDVWNRRSNLPGGFNANDQPRSQNPQISSLGNNFAFARVHRKGTGSAETINLHFLKSEFGTGSNYVNANTTTDPTLSFASTDQVQTMTSGYEWTLGATTSSHTCIAVEISTADDPVVTPTLLGRAPGWPTTDLSVLYDNNKAQRNMGVYTDTAGSGVGSFVTYYAIIHNAATHIRDLILYYRLTPDFERIFKRASLSFPEANNEMIEIQKDKIIFKKMKPGENRWLGLTIPSSSNLKNINGLVGVEFTEVEQNMPINGFTIAVKGGSLKETMLENIHLFIENLFRIGAIFNWQEARDEGNTAKDLMVRSNVDENNYLKYLSNHSDILVKFSKQLIKENSGEDPFQVLSATESLITNVKSKDLGKTIVSQRNYNHKMDAFLSMLDKRNGDIADILQNILWQKELFVNKKEIKNLEGISNLINATNEFEARYRTRKFSLNDFSDLIRKFIPLYKVVDKKIPRLELAADIGKMQSAINDPKMLQKVHSDFLFKLESL